MPFLLRAEAGQYVQLQTRIDYASSDNFLIAVEANPLQNINFWRPIGGNDFAASSPRVLAFGGGRVRLTTDQGDREWLTGVDISTIHTLEFSRNSGQLDLLINGNLIGGGFSGNTDTISGFRIFNANFGSTSATTVDYKSILFERNGIVIHNYNKQVISGPNDTVFPDTVGGNDGTLVNFPTDNSQWVFFSGGGATYTITLDSGSYSLSGQDVALLSNKLISLESGAYTYDGQNVDLFAGRSISLEQGNYAYAGQNINLLASRSISLEPANYTYTGQDVTLVYNPSGGPTYLLTIDAGAYNYSGQDTQLIANRTLSIDSGAYAYTGSDLSLLANRSISIDSGAYVVTGNAVVLSANRAITLDAGNYAYTGSPVTLSYSGEVIALVSGYSVNYAQDAATATYTDDYIKARFI